MSFLSLSDLDLRPKWCDRPEPGPAPRSFPPAEHGLSVRATARRLAGSPIGHPGRSVEEPQSFDLFKLGQKVGGGIIHCPRQVKPRSMVSVVLGRRCGFWRAGVHTPVLYPTRRPG